MAKTAATLAQPRVGGGGRRRSIVDCRQMELFSAPVSEPAMTPLPAPISAPELVSFAADLFEAANVDAQRAKPPTKIEEPPPPANDEIDSEAVVLLVRVRPVPPSLGLPRRAPGGATGLARQS